MNRRPLQKTNDNNESTYPCQICSVTDNRPIVCCDGCNLWFHFECVNAPADVEKYEWFCVVCRQRIATFENVPESKSQQQTNVVMQHEEIRPVQQLGTTPAGGQSTSSQLPVPSKQPRSVLDPPIQPRKAKSNGTASTKRRSLALLRLEEERKLELEEQARREQRNKEYLDKKFSILEQEIESDIDDADLSFDDEEIEQQKFESIKRWTEGVKGVEDPGLAALGRISSDLREMSRTVRGMRTTPATSQVAESNVEQILEVVNVNPPTRLWYESSTVSQTGKPGFITTVADINPRQSLLTRPPEHQNNDSALESRKNPSNGQASNYNAPGASNSQILTRNVKHPLVRPLRSQNNHPALEVQENPANGQAPNYNAPGASNSQMMTQSNTKRSYFNNRTRSEPEMLQYDRPANVNRVRERLDDVNDIRRQYGFEPIQFHEMFGHQYVNEPVDETQEFRNQSQIHDSEANQTFVLNSTRREEQSQPPVSDNIRHSDSRQHSNQNPFIGYTDRRTFRSSNQQQSGPRTETIFNQRPIGSTSEHQSNNQQPIGSGDHQPPLGFNSLNGPPPLHIPHQQENREGNDDQNDGVGLVNNQNLRQNDTITMEHIMSRQVIDKKLPIFTGDPEEWNAWYNRYLSTTEKCKLDNSENLDRLQKCLQGRALGIVKSKLSQTDAVPWIIATLQKVFGRPETVLKAVMDRIKALPTIKSDNLKSVMEFAFEVQSVSTTIESSAMLNQYTNPMLLEELVQKLPAQTKLEWARYKRGARRVTIKTFTDWLDELADDISSVIEPTVEKHQAKISNKGTDKEKAFVNTHMEGSTEPSSKKSSSCIACDKNCKQLGKYSAFKGLSLDQKWTEVKKHKLCRLCLKKHKFPCNLTTVCGKNGCSFKHHYLLHNDEKHPPKKDSQVARNNFHHVISCQVMLKYAPVVLHYNNKRVVTFAFFDDGSQASMLEQNLADKLSAVGTEEELCLLWTENIHRKEDAQRISIEVSGLNDLDCRFPLNGIRAVHSLHLPPQTYKKEEFVERFPHLAKVPMGDYENAVPGIIIASDFPKLGIQMKVIEGNGYHSPIAQKTRLGWVVYGPVGEKANVNYVNNHHVVQVCPHHNCLDQEIHQQIKEYFSIENFGVRANTKSDIESKDNQRALEMLTNLTKMICGRYETGLLWKNDNINKNLPDSYPMALKRLNSLEKQGEQMVQRIGVKVKEYVEKGYARKLSESEVNELGKDVWYLPVFGVIHPKKPDKLRMVFDGAAKVKKTSFNSMLLIGPDELASLVDVLRRFREKLYAVGGDIEEMFLQVKMQKSDQSYQLFLFRDGKTGAKPDVYVIQVMFFGSRCSPAAAQFVRNTNARKFESTHPRAVEAIIDNHYVDDMMDGENTIEATIKMVNDVKKIHASGGFRIRNFISNSPEVLRAIGSTDNDKSKEFSLNSELKTERVLGMWWNTKNDVFTFSLKYTLITQELLNGTKLPTKRELLRTLMSIFDPLGLLSNYLVLLKILLQDVWRSDLKWDEQISSDNLVNKWKQWLKYLPSVESVQVPRLYSLKLISDKPKTVEIHTFVDASVDAFSAVAYLRIIDRDGIDCALIGSKAKVAPLKYLSIPRKELQAGVLGSRLAISISEAQRFKVDRRVFWSDSETVLSWLKSDHKKYSQYVAHRVGEILESTDVNEWRWISTTENVADEATKCAKYGINFEASNRWFSGPKFLRSTEDKWPKKKSVKPDVEEEMKAHCTHASLVLPQLVNSKRFSKWNRMVRAVAYLVRFRNVFVDKNCRGKPLSQEELTAAENHIFRQAQFEGFPSEMVTLLYDGSPYLDGNGILRMRGRIDGARDLSLDSKRPIVLPKDSRITRLLVQHYHARYFHQNHNTVINEIRQRFYIPRIRVLLKSVRSECQMCKVKFAKIMEPQMADLPPERMATFTKPFSFVGVDYFGPLKVKIGRRKEKRWGVLFTCMTVRAIHIELVPTLNANSCIMAVRNLIADRGEVTEFHSDCGTHFTGAESELKRELKKLDWEKLQTEFTSSFTKWIFNPPASPHMGGSWERLIRSVKSGVFFTLPTRAPSEEMLRNVLKEMQNIVNSRPLTLIPLEVEEDEALNGMKAPCGINVDGKYLRKSWKEAQRLAEMFWRRFLREYLPNLTRRTKWHKQVKPISVNDLVLVIDEKNPRNTYPRGRVLETRIGSNNQVRRARIELIAEAKITADGKISKVRKTDMWRPAHKLAVLDVLSQPEVSFAKPEMDRKTGGRMLETNVNTEPRRSARIAQKSGNTRDD